MKTTIVEDEPLAQNELKRLLLRADKQIEVLAFLYGVASSVEWLSSNAHPDLIFLDIQLSDGQSFEIFSEVEIKCPVIFTTAYDTYAIKAFEVNSIDYLLKPIEPDAIKRALDKYQALKTNHGGSLSATLSAEQIREITQLNQLSYKTRFKAVVGDKIKFVTEDQVAYFIADDNVVFLVTNDQKNNLLTTH